MDLFQVGDAISAAQKKMGTVIFPTVVLFNGLRIMNFNSPHPFTFIDGSVLPPAPDKVAMITMTKVVRIKFREGRYDLVNPTFNLNPPMKALLMKAKKYAKVNDVDIVIVPRVLLDVLKENDIPLRWEAKKDGRVAEVCTILLSDRVKKLIHTHRFCQ